MEIIKFLKDVKIELTGGFAIAFILYSLYGASLLIVNACLFIRNLAKK